MVVEEAAAEEAVVDTVRLDNQSERVLTMDYCTVVDVTVVAAAMHENHNMDDAVVAVGRCTIARETADDVGCRRLDCGCCCCCCRRCHCYVTPLGRTFPNWPKPRQSPSF